VFCVGSLTLRPDEPFDDDDDDVISRALDSSSRGARRTKDRRVNKDEAAAQTVSCVRGTNIYPQSPPTRPPEARVTSANHSASSVTYVQCDAPPIPHTLKKKRNRMQEFLTVGGVLVRVCSPVRWALRAPASSREELLTGRSDARYGSGGAGLSPEE